MADNEEWVVWNGSLGVLDKVAIGRVEQSETGRLAYLADPYSVVGPFSLDELEKEGRIAFGACFVMSSRRWKEDQVELRLQGRAQRRAFQMRFDFDQDDDEEHRKALNLPLEGDLDPAEIRAAFRREAKTAHPDAGGSDELYRRIAEARDALLEQFAGAA
ncbi:J domain-containing protein [Methylosinus sp. Sm6]|uniref:J domain-containing protein n=1 Tax=Methylosinus sp. Sm6 TaxID=2866948 RepID=UPI001C99E17D|nr:J domain-containing protein [Methylosinus sp. Sm6]MBY6241276.1 J domain-containing protein [Methylosinus sp. Sm6]